MKQQHNQSSNLKQGSADRGVTGSKQDMSGGHLGRGSMNAGSSGSLESGSSGRSEGSSRERKSSSSGSRSSEH
jgi:hypothetical protein